MSQEVSMHGYSTAVGMVPLAENQRIETANIQRTNLGRNYAKLRHPEDAKTIRAFGSPPPVSCRS